MVRSYKVIEASVSVEIRIAGYFSEGENTDDIMRKTAQQVEHLVNAENHKFSHSVHIRLRSGSGEGESHG